MGSPADGYPLFPREGIAEVDGRARMKAPGVRMDTTASYLSLQLVSPVNDQTGLTGKYDFDLFWSMRPPDADDNGPDLVTAVREQLGLNLKRGKVPVNVLVIDHAEKTPTPN